MQRARLENDGGFLGLGEDAVGISHRRLAGRGGGDDLGDDVDEIGRVEPGAALCVEILGGGSNADGAGIGGVVGGGDVGGQAFGKGKGLDLIVGVY